MPKGVDIGGGHCSGSSLIETLVSAALIGVLSTALAASASSMSTTARLVLDDLDTTRSMGRFRDVVPQDLSEYPEIDTSPTALDHLPGTNAITLSQGTSPTGDLVSYRYVEVDGSWDLVRFHLDDTGVPAEPSPRRTIATRLAAPPEGWSRNDSPIHAIAVTTRPASSISSYAAFEERSIDLTFAAGTRIGAGAVHRTFSDVPTIAEPNTIVPSHRCGGTIAVVLNTSSTIWSQGAASTVAGDLIDVINSLRGTPTHLRVVTFDRQALSFYPDVAIGTYVDLLNPSSSITTLLSKLTTLSTTSSSWRNGRNWEDGLWQATRLNTGTLLAQPPDLVIFITDGSPNRNRTNTTSDTDTTFHTADLTRAVTAAHYARNTGAVLMGMMLGTGATSTATGHLTSVFGMSTWEGSNVLLPLDRARSFIRPTTEGFVRLDEMLSLIAKWRCGGTVTVQQRVLTGGVSNFPADAWTIGVSMSESAPTSTVTVDADRPSATVDAVSPLEGAPRLITLTQGPRNGFHHHSTTCTSAGTSIPLQTTTGPDGTTVIRLTAPADAIVSCVLTAQVVS